MTSTAWTPPVRRTNFTAGRIAAVVLALVWSAAGIGAADTNTIAVVVPMVRVEVATSNAAVNQTYELEIDSFDGQRLRGFEPQKDPGAVRSLITINMGSVVKIQFYNTTIERDAPKQDRPRPQPGEHDPAANEGPGQKEFLRRLEAVDTERGEYQLFKSVQNMKDPEYRVFEARLYELLASCDTEEKIHGPARATVLVAFFHDSLEQAKKFEHMTKVEYYQQTSTLLKQAQKDALTALQANANATVKAAAQKLIESPDMDMRRALWAAWAWNAVAPADRADDPALRKPGMGKLFKGPRGGGGGAGAGGAGGTPNRPEY